MKKKIIMFTVLLAVLLVWLGTVSGEEVHVPTLSELYPGKTASLKMYDNSVDRTRAYMGPDKSYVSGGDFLPEKQRKVIVYYQEGSYILAHLSYKTVEDRFLYFRQNRINCDEAIPMAENVLFYPCTVNQAVTPLWGPGEEYVAAKKYKVSEGSEARVFFKENGYYYTEISTTEGMVRMWLPISTVTLTGDVQSYTREFDTKVAVTAEGSLSYYFDEDDKDYDDKPKKGWSSWSPWQEAYIAETPDREVQTTTVYRKRIEVWDEMDEVEWNGNREDIPENCVSTSSDGDKIYCTLVVKYHWEWTDWHENWWYLHASTGDFDYMDSKTLYRYRTRE